MGTQPEQGRALAESLARLAESLGVLLKDRPDLRRIVHDLAGVVAAATEDHQHADRAAPDRLDAPVAQEPAAPQAQRPPDGRAVDGKTEPASPASEPAPIPELKIGGATANEEFGAVLEQGRNGATPTARVSPADLPSEPPDLSWTAASCRVKAEACRWAVEKRRRLAEGADFFRDLREREDELKARIKALAPTSYIPVLHRDGPAAGDEELERLGHAFDNLAAAAELCASADQADLRLSIEPLAEAQSAVRTAVLEARLPYDDADQADAFRWIGLATKAHGIYIERYLRLDDPADPALWAELKHRIDACRDRADRRRAVAKRRSVLFGKVKYAAEQVRRGPIDPEHQWGVLLGSVDELIETGLPASDTTLREALLPVIGLLPESIVPPPGAARALREVEGHAVRAQEAPPEETPEETRPAPSAELAEARERLRGRVAVLIGGEERPSACEDRRRALSLAELRWATKKPHASTAPFETEIARPEVAVVFFLSKLSNKQDGPDVRRMCKKHDKPCVMLAAGYSAEQMAHQFMQQASGSLAPAGM